MYWLTFRVSCSSASCCSDTPRLRRLLAKRSAPPTLVTRLSVSSPARYWIWRLTNSGAKKESRTSFFLTNDPVVAPLTSRTTPSAPATSGYTAFSFGATRPVVRRLRAPATRSTTPSLTPIVCWRSGLTRTAPAGKAPSRPPTRSPRAQARGACRRTDSRRDGPSGTGGAWGRRMRPRPAASGAGPAVRLRPARCRPRRTTATRTKHQGDADRQAHVELRGGS